MITKFKLFENIGISWVSPDIRKILAEYDMDIVFRQLNNMLLVSNDISYDIGIDINSTNLESLFDTLDRAVKIFEISKNKIVDIKDKIIEYYININISNFSILSDFMSDKLLKKLEENPISGKVATEELVNRSANKYNL
jgi:hypothetical protein